MTIIRKQRSTFEGLLTFLVGAVMVHTVAPASAQGPPHPQIVSPVPAPTPTPQPGAIVLEVVVQSGKKPQPGDDSVAWIPALRATGADDRRVKIAQNKKQFEPRIAVVSTGSTVDFPNFDRVFHNVFSLSKPQPFDLGLYRRGKSESVRFQQPGLIQIYCNIHPHMVAYLMVVDSRRHGVADADGRITLRDIPPGPTLVEGWNVRSGMWSREVRVRPGRTERLTVELDASSWREAPHLNKYGKEYPPPMTTTSDTDLTQKVSEDYIDTVAAVVPKRQTAAGRPTPKQRGLGLAAQFFVLAAALLALTLGLTVAVAAWRSALVAEQTIREDLARVPEVWEGYSLSRSSAALEQVRSLAREPGTLAIFADEVDLSTRLSFATEDAPQMLQEASTIFLFDRYSGVLARSDRPDGSGVGQPFAGVGWVASVLDTWQGTTAFIRERESLAMVAAAPVIAGEGDGAQLQGVLAVTFPIGERALAQLQTLTRGEVAIVADMARRGEAPQPGLSAASPGVDGDALVAAVTQMPEALDGVFLGGTVYGPVTIGAAADAREALAVPIFNSSGESLAALLVARSRAEEMASFYAIRRGLMIAGALMLLLSLPVSYLLGRRIAGPLQKLARGAELIRDGRLDVELPETGSGEVGVLAGAFAAMVEELREKDALEQLVADMRSRSSDTGPESTRTASPATGVARDARLPAIGEVFGDRYKIRSELGRGGMGVVFRASDLELEEDVALKVMRPEAFAEATDGVAKLKQEVRLARRISHPNVIRVHDLVEADGLRCLSMEYIPGTTLLEVLRQHGGLRLAPGLQVAKQLCRGLTAVHSQGIVHRDLKPQNVMVLPNGVVKLMDFGVSSGLKTTGTNEEGMVVGTPAYMSPEQCRGQDLDFRSDLYSLGIVLWEMFAGKIPFSGTTVGSLIQQQLNTTAPPLRGARADIPPELEQVVMACLAKNPEHRPVSASLIYQSLRDVLVTDW